MKIGIVTGDIPSTTFIERLISGLAKNDLEIIVFGKIKSKVKARKNVRLVGIHHGTFERIEQKVALLLLNIQLSVSQNQNKKRLNTILKKEGRYTTSQRLLHYQILSHKPDVLHVQWAKTISHFMWVKNFGIKLVLSLRGAHINYSPHTVPGLAEEYRKHFPKIDGFHGVSHAICKEAAKYGASLERCKVVYSGFDTTQFSKDFWVDKTHKIETLKILSIGRSHWKKGYSFAVDAMHVLKEKDVQFAYTIVGAAGNEELEFQRHQLCLDTEVTLFGAVPFLEVKKMIAEADVLLLPSVEEGIANVVLEAMFLGTVVVTTNCGGMIESVDNGITGIVVPLRNVEEIAAGLIRIYNSSIEEREALRSNAYEFVIKQHSEERMVTDMISLYQKV